MPTFLTQQKQKLHVESLNLTSSKRKSKFATHDQYSGNSRQRRPGGPSFQWCLGWNRWHHQRSDTSGGSHLQHLCELSPTCVQLLSRQMNFELWDRSFSVLFKYPQILYFIKHTIIQQKLYNNTYSVYFLLYITWYTISISITISI